MLFHSKLCSTSNHSTIQSLYLKFSVSIFLLFFSYSSFSQVWINELHYDNSGGDVNECIEILAPAGTDLTQYSIVLYNGNGGGEYATLTFSGSITDEGCGFGTAQVCYPTGIQNGGHDGLALIGPGSTVVQFLSYEGSFTATNGPASGQSSIDIGVSEGSSTTGTQSLQLTGSGDEYDDFTWQSPSTSSFGSLNSGQSIAPCGGGVSNTISTGTLTGATFNVDCTTSDNGTLTFTSTGTFNGGNTFTAQLSDASGSFAAPTEIGVTAEITGMDPSGSIDLTIPSETADGTNYRIRIVSSNPSTTSDTTAVFEIVLDGEPCASNLPSSQGLLINEFSNGTTGQEEFYEFVVAGRCGDIVDVRGYILDDNNGTFSATFPSSSGIAPGHLRLTNDAQWSNIPVGSLIVIYNSAERNPAVPADDPFDSNNDSLYVIPHDHATLFELTSDLPQNSVNDSIYSPVNYNNSSWNPLSIRNAGDAIQVRSPDGSYWHGVSYGGSEITGGPDNMKINNGSMSGEVGYFTDGDFKDASNWSVGTAGTAAETPGQPNNAANLAWLRLMRDPNSAVCPIVVLPVEITLYSGENTEAGNKLTWTTQTEINSD